MADPKNNNGTAKKFKQPPKSRPPRVNNNMMNPPKIQSTSDSDKCKMIQQQLLLFMHAFDCQRRETGPDSDKHTNCQVPFCKVMKDKLNHLSQCQDGNKCKVADCTMSRQILDHWKDCANKNDCMVCSPLNADGKQYINNINNNNNNNNNNKVMGSSLSAGNSVGLQKIDWSNVKASKEWKSPISRNQRDSLVILLFQAILSSCDRNTVSEERMNNLTEFAKNVEAKAYANAKSNQEYYHLLVEKVYQIQKSIDEKALKKKKLTMPLAEILQKLETIN